jgi:Holliday junction resolvase RusA-like endonuclease
MSGLADIQLVLAEPPSANRIWRMWRGRMRKSDEYRAWKDAQAASIAHQLGGDCALEWFGVAITIPPSRRDPDNGLKPILDALQAGGAVRNDRLLRHLSLKVDEDREPGTVAVAVWTAAPPKAKPKTRKARA